MVSLCPCRNSIISTGRMDTDGGAHRRGGEGDRAARLSPACRRNPGYQLTNLSIKEVSDPGVVAPGPRVRAHARPEAAVPGRRWQGARHGRRAVAHAPPAAARGPRARAYAPPAARRDAAVVQSPRGGEALGRRVRAVAHGPPAAVACEQREAGL